MTKKKTNTAAAVIAAIIILLSIGSIAGYSRNTAYARSETEYTNVLSDLQKDSAFNITDYPDNSKDYSIKVIQIAESDKNELFLYTYQPCQKTRYLIATDINMSFSKSADGTELYELILVNTSGVFAKYLVKDIKVNESQTRFYNITSIYRAWDKDLDDGTGNNNTVEKKAFAVRNIYRVTTENGEKFYSCEPTYAVKIINPYADFLIYTTSSSLPSIPSIKFNFEKMGYMDAHYLAFSTDWEIERLISATVTFNYSSGTGYYNTFLGFDCGSDVSFTKPQTAYAYPKYIDKVEHKGDFWHNGRKYNYSWDRIQTVAEFLASEKNLTDETKTNLQGKQWILRFVETSRTQKTTGILGYKNYKTEFTKVDNVATLQMEFETDGITYNLGTISDIVSGDELPGNTPKEDKGDFWDYIWDCLVKLFTGKANAWKTFVGVATILVAVIVFVIAVKFIRWVINGLFGGGKE